jgi:hypothetical protein
VLAAVLVLFAYMSSVSKERNGKSVGGVHLTDEEEAAVEAGIHDVTEDDNQGLRYIL